MPVLARADATAVRCILTVLLLFFAGTVHADALDQRVDDWRSQAGIPRLAYAIIENGQLTHSAERGDGSAQAGARPTYAIGSLSKAFTAHAILVLAERGDLDLDRELLYYLPELQLQGPRADTLSARHLLAHQSGLSRRIGYQGRASLALRLQDLQSARLLRAPGSGFEYSNANYELLGILIERITGLPYTEALRSLVLAPLGVEAGFADAAPAGNGVGHQDWFGLPIVLGEDGIAPSEWPSGGLRMRLADYLTYLQAHLAAAGGDSRGALSADGYAAWHATAADSSDDFYAYGWFRRRLGEGQLLGHEGLTAGFNSAVLMDPQRGFAVVVLASSNSFPLAGRPAAQQIASNLARELLGQPQRWDGFAGLATAFWVKLALLAVFLASVAWGLRTVAACSRRQLMIKLMLGMGLAALLCLALPDFLGVPLRAILAFTPDVGLLLLAASAFAVLQPLLRYARVHKSIAS